MYIEKILNGPENVPFPHIINTKSVLFPHLRIKEGGQNLPAAWVPQVVNKNCGEFQP